MYGVPLALSSQFYDRLPSDVQKYCRQVDSVRRRTNANAAGQSTATTTEMATVAAPASTATATASAVGDPPCADNDAAFSASPTSMGMPSCLAMKQQLGAESGRLCTDQSMAAAVQVGCRATCNLCSRATSTAATSENAVPVNGVQPSVGAAPIEAPEPTGPVGTSFRVTVLTRTDRSAANIVARVNLLKTYSIVFLQMFHAELRIPSAGNTSALPTSLWLHITGAPAVMATTTTIPPLVLASSALPMVMGIIAGSIFFISICSVCTWFLWKDHTSAHIQDASTVTEEASSGGWRVKKTQNEAELVQLSLCTRFFRQCRFPCLTKCCTRKLRRVVPTDEIIQSAPVTIGAEVKLCGLSQLQYNGLLGKVISGPNDKGRFEVEIWILDTSDVEEFKTMSFKPDNLGVVTKAPKKVPIVAQREYATDADSMPSGLRAAAAGDDSAQATFAPPSTAGKGVVIVKPAGGPTSEKSYRAKKREA